MTNAKCAASKCNFEFQSNTTKELSTVNVTAVLAFLQMLLSLGPAFELKTNFGGRKTLLIATGLAEKNL
ncbi:hypothetical protein BT96DRAFT_210357 [Gymnopus androsaceus JB14]|uniref:Uncharacterized protein n=1 Tax=Gymnopus androsaceus JB14 TaxID=1447944 RepID=A0A6A4H9P9_9AGAR|nr:hypothetical protein BT96DRAFT_210357 [Gymnopus androsaceus JB14]